MIFLIFGSIIAALLLYKIFFSKSNNFFKEHGIPEIDTSPAVGTFDLLLGRKLITDADDYAYTQMKKNSQKFGGIMSMGTPLVLVRDTELLKRVLIKHFDHFVDRRALFTKEDGVVKQMLTGLEGDEWKGVRASVSPTFTTGKIRRMMEIFNEVGHEWVDQLTKKAGPSGSFVMDVSNSVNQYTVEVISKAAFGMSAGAISNPDSVFMKMTNEISNVSTGTLVKLAMRFCFPKLCSKLGITTVNMKCLGYFEKILAQNLKSRMDGETKQNDFLQLLVEAKRGELKASGADELNNFEKDAQIEVKEKREYLTEENMNAQCLVFFFAGFSTTSGLISFMLYALALNPEVQEKLRQEVKKSVKEDGSMDYDDVNQLVYMEMVMCETLRKSGALGRLERLCSRDYKDEETGLFIPKGTMVGIPANGFHQDKDLYENAEKFDPEHFSAEKKAKRGPYAFMPFGVGPRNCIGMRFAQIEAKSAIAHIVNNFLIEPTQKTPVPMKGKNAGLGLMPPDNLEVKLTPLKSK